MRYEWKKISRSAVILLMAVVLVNAWMFYSHCQQPYDGYSLSQIQEVFYWSEEAITQKDAALGGQIISTGPDGLIKQSLYKAVNTRRDFDYANYLQSFLDDIEVRIQSGLFGDQNSFAVKSMIETQAIYQPLCKLQVEPTFSGSLEVWNDWQISDLFFLFFGCVSSMFLLTQEWRSGVYALLKPTKKGRGSLYLRKFCVMSAAIFVGFLLIYGTDLAICGYLFGFGDLARPIQSAYGFQECPAALTVLGYLLSYFGAKLLWGWALCGVFFAICSVMRSVSTVLLCTVGILFVSLAMDTADNLWLRTFSLTAAVNEQLFLQCRFLNFFGTPLRQLPLLLGFCGMLVPLSCGFGFVAYIKSPAVISDKGKGTLRLHILYCHTNLFLHEMYKCLWTHKVIILLLVLLAIQIFSYSDFDKPNSEWDYYYRQYSNQLSGPPSMNSDQFLAEEQARFDRIYDEIADCYERAHGDTAVAELLSADLQNELRAEPAFFSAREQYENLQADEHYVYRTGYDRLFEKEGQRDYLLNTIKLLCFLILSFSGTFAVEQETGMEVLQVSIGVKRKLLHRKLVVCGIILLVAFVLAHLPQYLAVLHNYGLPEQGAVVSSLSVLAAFPGNWTIRSTLWIIRLLRLLLSTAASLLILKISQKTGNQVLTVLLGFGLLVLPATVILLLL